MKLVFLVLIGCIVSGPLAWALPVPLPEVMVLDDGRRVAGPQDWQDRRAELAHHLQSSIYGFAPAPITPRVEVRSEIELAAGHYRDVRLLIPTASGEHEVRLALFLPTGAGPHPVVLQLNKCGNETTHPSSEITPSGKAWQHPKYCFDKKNRPVGRGAHAEAYGVTQLLKAGFGVATIAESDLSADSPLWPDIGLKTKFSPHSDPAQRWGTVRTWAWGLSRAVDYLQAAPGVDRARITTAGHSRRGKAALLAAAFDERIAAAIPHQSGLGGTAPLRCPIFRENAEMVSYGWGGYYYMGESEGVTHFFAGALKRHSKNIETLPVDTNGLVALVAPRPVLDIQGTRDFWAGPTDSLRALESAAPVWSLLGRPENAPTQVRLRKGHHIGAEDWDAIIAFLAGATLKFSE